MKKKIRFFADKLNKKTNMCFNNLQSAVTNFLFKTFYNFVTNFQLFRAYLKETSLIYIKTTMEYDSINRQNYKKFIKKLQFSQ